jgi:NitT/TauT family transport system substrate-binding protein
MLVTATDVVSPSYFVATAAVELGYFAAEGVDAEFVFPKGDASLALREGSIDFYAASPYVALMAFPEWRGGKLLCALSQGAYWTLAMRADLGAVRGDLAAVRGRRILAGPGPAIALRQLLKAGGIEPERDGVQIVSPPWGPPPDGNQARQGARAIEEDVADGFWGNSLRSEYAVQRGLASVLIDVRQGDAPPAARRFTFPALAVADRLIEEHPEAAAGAVRAIVKTQRALAADPSLARKAAARLFPAEEAEMIVDLVARDAPYYDATISEDAAAGAAEFAKAAELISEPVRYDAVVATQLRALWNG